MKTSFFLSPFSRCLSKEILDVLIVSKHRLSKKTKEDAMNHLQDCPTCRARCLSRIASLEGRDQVGVLKPEGFLPTWSNSQTPTATFLPGLSASVAAVCILGVALLSPLFLRQGVQIVAPQVRQHKEGTTSPAASNSNVNVQKDSKKKVESTPAQRDALLRQRMMVLKKFAEMNALNRRIKGVTPNVELTPAQRKALLQERAMVQKMFRERRATTLRLRGVTPSVELTPARRKALIKERMMVQEMLREQKNLLDNSEVLPEKRIKRQ